MPTAKTTTTGIPRAATFSARTFQIALICCPLFGFDGSEMAGSWTAKPGPTALCAAEPRPTRCGPSSDQDGQRAASQNMAVVKGRVVVPKAWQDDLKPDEVAASLTAEIEIPDPPLPNNWDQMTFDGQMEWWEKFQQTEAGKAYVAENERRLAEAPRFDVRLEPDGNFVVFDVPAGTYSLQGRVDRTIRGQLYAFQLSGQLEVSDQVDELVLGDMELIVTPIIQRGQVAPAFEAKDLDGRPVTLDTLGPHSALICFWASTSQPSRDFLNEVVTATQKLNTVGHSLTVVAPCLDLADEDLKKLAADHGESIRYLSLGSWQHPMAVGYGVRAIPALILIDAQRAISMPSSEFGLAMRTSGMSLEEIIAARLSGKKLPHEQEPPKPAAGDGK